MHRTHVFLGPTLDLDTAHCYLSKAHYHPPIQCGDIIRLLRLSPSCIVIIDGLYEQVPAVWHKEIMMAMDKGIQVYGAASMGAIRAAELHHYGMKGVGKIFQAFATQQLNDDDEVAVLHQGCESGYLPLNDAMVNIRETLNVAQQENIISIGTKEALIKECKSQFYPNRSLLKTLNSMNLELMPEILPLREWLQHHHLVDVKRQDAIAVLEQVQQSNHNENVAKVQTPYTKFIASLVDDEVVLPFHNALTWLPEKEQILHHWSLKRPEQYRLVVELAGLMKNASAVIEPHEFLDDRDEYVTYIQQHHLYFSESLHQFLQEHGKWSSLSTWVLHHTCLGNITRAKIESYSTAAAFYFDDVSQDIAAQPLLNCLGNALGIYLKSIVLFVLLLHQQLNDERLMIKRDVFEQHLQELQIWKRLKQVKQPSRINPKAVLEFIVIYMKVIYIHHGLKDFKLGIAHTPEYFHWVYDAIALYEYANGV